MFFIFLTWNNASCPVKVHDIAPFTGHALGRFRGGPSEIEWSKRLDSVNLWVSRWKVDLWKLMPGFDGFESDNQ